MSETTNLKTLQQELQEALSLINDYSKTHNGTTNNVLDAEGLNNTQSLLERCAAVVDNEHANSKPTLRIIHHFACSGGTLISKCLAAQPNVFLLSELHPTTQLGMNMEKAVYTPRDITTQAMYGQVPNVDELAEKLFVNGIIEAEKHISDRGGYLVIRSHTHADYCTDKPLPEVDTLTRLLKPHFNIKNLVTIRDPIDSFLSLRENGWVHFKPDGFEHYCERLLKFLEPFEKDEIFKYEDFVAKPKGVLKDIAEVLCLSHYLIGLECIDIFKVSGDSGRSGVEIKPRKKKALDDDMIDEISQSRSYKVFRERYGF